MPVICSICLETLVHGGVEPPPPGKHAVGLICGHLFHADCIGKSFRDKPAPAVEGQAQVFGTCPLCQVVSSIDQSIKVFPSVDDDDMVGQLTAAQGRIHDLSIRNRTVLRNVFMLSAGTAILSVQNSVLRQEKADFLRRNDELITENTEIGTQNRNLQEEVINLKKCLDDGSLILKTLDLSHKNSELSRDKLRKMRAKDRKKIVTYKKRNLKLRCQVQTQQEKINYLELKMLHCNAADQVDSSQSLEVQDAGNVKCNEDGTDSTHEDEEEDNDEH